MRKVKLLILIRACDEQGGHFKKKQVNCCDEIAQPQSRCFEESSQLSQDLERRIRYPSEWQCTSGCRIVQV